MNGEKWDQRRNQKVSGNKWKQTQTTQNLWDTGKAVLRGNYIATQANLKKTETFKQTT